MRHFTKRIQTISFCSWPRSCIRKKIKLHRLKSSALTIRCASKWIWLSLDRARLLCCLMVCDIELVVEKNESDLHKLDVSKTYCKNTPGLLIVTCWFCSSFQLLMIPLIMSVLYIWAQFNKDTVVSFWFGTQFKVRPSNVECSIFLSGSRFTEISERIKYT